MNPYLNRNLDVVGPFGLGCQLSFDTSIFSYIYIAGTAVAASLVYMRSEARSVTCMLQLSCRDTQGILYTLVVRLIDIALCQTHLTSTPNNTIILVTGSISDAVQLFTGLLPICQNNLTSSPLLHGYKDVLIGDLSYTAPTYFYVQLEGLADGTLSGTRLTVSYRGERPALLLCRTPLRSSGFGVRSINGVYGKYLNITADTLIDINHVARDNQLDAAVRKIQLYSSAAGLGCRSAMS